MVRKLKGRLGRLALRGDVSADEEVRAAGGGVERRDGERGPGLPAAAARRAHPGRDPLQRAPLEAVLGSLDLSCSSQSF